MKGWLLVISFLHRGFQASQCLGTNMWHSIQYVCAALLPKDLSYSNAFKEQDAFILFPSKILGYTDRSHGVAPLYFCAWDLMH